ncbi:hypothetical protein CMI37_37615, partial [Candidatus Pacearchaeota archaeon]|nr:hypothetical protein [Candidatus Pacearchaeota archaeon]
MEKKISGQEYVSHPGPPRGLEVACPICKIACKLFIPRYEHYCPNHGWFKKEMAMDEENTETDTPTSCKFMTRNNTLCKAPRRDGPCGYHSSATQITKENNLKETIVTIFNEAKGADCSIPPEYANSDISAYELLHKLFQFIP